VEAQGPTPPLSSFYDDVMSQGRHIVAARESGISIRTSAEIADAIGACLTAEGLLLTEEDLSPRFFDLRTGLAGEALQKFVNYRVRVAIVVPRPEVHGERFVELAREHATHPMVRFFETEDAARTWLATA
jgi:hypothetical protein